MNNERPATWENWDFPEIVKTEGKDWNYQVGNATCRDLANAITELLGWCGCGYPEVALEYIRKGLALIGDKYDDKVHEWKSWYAEHRVKVNEHYGDQGAEYFFYYWADFHGLTEHGGSVPGWLTSKGKELIRLIEKLEDEESE